MDVARTLVSAAPRLVSALFLGQRHKGRDETGRHERLRGIGAQVVYSDQFG
jgi:hypothetical protein